MQLNFFELACNGSHKYTGQWKDPADNTQGKSQTDHYLWLAKLAEKGKSLKSSLPMLLDQKDDFRED
jgi:hypothetical protein